MLKYFLKNFAVILLSLSLVSNCFAGIDFDGTDDNLCSENHSSTNLLTQHPLTIIALIYPDALGTNIIEYGERVTTTTGFRLALTSSTASELVYTTLAVKDYLTTTFTIVTGEWQVVAVSVDSLDDATLYHWRISTDTWINETINHTADMNAPSAESDLIIGALHTNTTGDTCSELTSFFDGVIADVKLYATNLSQTQIQDESKALLKNFSLSPTNLKLYYPMNDQEAGTSADGDTIRDLSGNGNNNTGVNGANNTGLLFTGESVLSYPSPILGQQ